jgi:hypothetical protein
MILSKSEWRGVGGGGEGGVGDFMKEDVKEEGSMQQGKDAKRRTQGAGLKGKGKRERRANKNDKNFDTQKQAKRL